MAILYKTAKQVCQHLTKTVNDMTNGLNFYVIPHHGGQRNDALTIEASEFSGHKAEQFMRRIISNKARQEDSTCFLGTAIAFEQSFFGLRYKPHRISIITVNIDQYEDMNELKADLYHHLWIALDKDEKIKKTDHGGQHEHHKYPIKADKRDITFRNLKADVFSVLMQSFENIPDAALTLATTRAQQAVHAEATHKTLYYIFPLAMESCQFLLNDLQRIPHHQQAQILLAQKLCEDIADNINDDSLESWWMFAEPAATMAWLDYTPQQILSACVNSGVDPLVRANGLLLQEILGIELLPPKELLSVYNSFGGKEQIEELHHHKSDESFEDALVQGLKLESNRPFLDEALFQNERLSQGKAIGWTASALQASARAFDKALQSGRTPEQAARLEYEGVKSKSNWESLESLSLKILEARQEGETTMLESIIETYADDQDYYNILESFKQTLNDPAYTNKLSIDPAPSGPALGQEPKPQAPALELANAPATPAAAMSAPSMGMGGTPPPLRAIKPLGGNNKVNTPPSNTEDNTEATDKKATDKKTENE